MALKAILFDLDDTLYDDMASSLATILEVACMAAESHDVDPEHLARVVRKTAKGIWYQSPMADFAVTVGMSSWEGLWAKFEGDSDESRQMRDWVAAYRDQVWYQSLENVGIRDDALAKRLAQAYPQIRRQNHHLFDDALPVVKQIGERYRLGLVTNGAVDLQSEKVDGAGLRDVFDTVAISGEVAVGKPHRAVFDLVLARLALSIDEVIMVGNSQKSDIVGANRIGMTSVWIERGSHSPDPNAQPDYKIDTLFEVLPIVDSLEAGKTK